MSLFTDNMIICTEKHIMECTTKLLAQQCYRSQVQNTKKSRNFYILAISNSILRQIPNKYQLLNDKVVKDEYNQYKTWQVENISKINQRRPKAQKM